MRSRILLLIVAVLVCVAATTAQTLNENDSSITVRDLGFEVSLAVESKQNVSLPITLELLDLKNQTVGKTVGQISTSKGKKTHKLFIPVIDAKNRNSSDLPWFRLKYMVGVEVGYVSLSQLLQGLHELKVVSSGEIYSGMRYKIGVLARHPLTKQPVSDVNLKSIIEILVKDNEKDDIELNATAITDKNGYAEMEFNIPLDANIDDGEIEINSFKSGLSKTLDFDLDAAGQNQQFLLLTDKPIYQPEQTLSIRGVLMRGIETKTVVSGQTLSFKIKDNDGTVLFTEKVKTSDYGVAAISWQIPESVKLGNYEIEVSDENADEVGNETVKISRYDLPNFVVNAKSLKSYYLTNENKAEIEVSADYLFGKPVEKGKVRVVRENERSWNWDKQKYDIDEGESKEGETTPDGKFKAVFDLTEENNDLKDRDYDLYDDLNFTAYFTDLSTNRTEQRRFDVRISKTDLHIYLQLKEYELSAEMPINSYISVSRADGTPVSDAQIEISGSEQSANKYKKIVTGKTNKFGAAKVTFKRPEFDGTDDDLDLKINARSSNGETGWIEKRLYFDNDDNLTISTDRSIYKPGQNISLTLRSSVKNADANIEVIRNRAVIASYKATIENGRGKFTLPYLFEMKGEINIGAYLVDKNERVNDRLVKDSVGVIFPAPENLNVGATFDKEIYKPGENGRVEFNIRDASGNEVESALGIVMFDRAVEERAMTDSSFGNIFRNYASWIGYKNSFGGFNFKDINDHDLKKPISPEMYLAAEAILLMQYYSPEIKQSPGFLTEKQQVYSSYFGDQFLPVSKALNHTYYSNNFEIAENESHLMAIMQRNEIDINKFRDPWGMEYKRKYYFDRENDVVDIISSGSDKIFDTPDDVIAQSFKYLYFTKTGNKITKAVSEYYMRTGIYIFDRKTLLDELGVDDLIDRYGNPYNIEFKYRGRNYTLLITSYGKDGKENSYNRDYDDFRVWQTNADAFIDKDRKIDELLQDAKIKPGTITEFTTLLEENGINLSEIYLGDLNSIYVKERKYSIFNDRVVLVLEHEKGNDSTVRKQKIEAITQELREFTLMHSGDDKTQGNYDDQTISVYKIILSEKNKDGDLTPQSLSMNNSTLPIGSNTFSDTGGKVTGIVSDRSGAVVPGAIISVINSETQIAVRIFTDSLGRYLVGGLADGVYSIRADSPGFLTLVYQQVTLKKGTALRKDFVLDVGAVNETVEVTSDVSVLNTTESSIATEITSNQISSLPTGKSFDSLMKLQPGVAKVEEPNSTPRLREYFPETLLWQPELITDVNGKARVQFKMADNITTWKLYTVATTKDGKVGISTKEVTAFQSFFADLDPPKFLTTGDEIYLPVQIRNYTATEQNVGVKMDKGNWFDFIDCANCPTSKEQKIKVKTNSSEIAIFGFRANLAVKEGKQRVTALADKESDAIERPITVRPDGEEVISTNSQFGSGGAEYEFAYPAHAINKTHRAELKLYPNLMSNVVESVEGLLRRPYGCGEQTISSTYPNLMILKFDDKKDRIGSVIKNKARRNLKLGYERLVSYQHDNGGFKYWGGSGDPDLSLTAYALRFLSEADDHIKIDENVALRAEKWLLSQQRAAGSWGYKYSWEDKEDSTQTKMKTIYVARVLAMRKPAKDTAARIALEKAMAFLKPQINELNEPYILALYGLASLDMGNDEEAAQIVKRLKIMFIEEGGTYYWNLETNTPFNGWGTAGRIETTALVTQLLIRSKHLIDAEKDTAKAKLFLIKNKDKYGVWYSTQTTINVLDAFLAGLGSELQTPKTIKISVNGKELKQITVTPDQIEQMSVDLSDQIDLQENKVVVNVSDNSLLMSQLVTKHYINWSDSESTQTKTNAASTIKLDYKCNKNDADIMEEITCSVGAERVGFRGYGMLLAEIGTPPGADVSRESLEKAMESYNGISSYEILPDRIIIYMWAKPGGTKFDFKFKPRYGVNAQTPASIIYDYYNPESRAVVGPLRFVVK